MRGHLDVNDLEKYKKADLQALARNLGVSDEGTIKEIAARCAAEEVDIPDDDQEAGDDQQAAPEGQEAGDNQQAAPEGQDATPENQGADDQQAAPEPQPDGVVMVEVVQTYQDLELKRIVKKGERLPMKAERAAVIIGKALGEAVED